MQMPQESKIKVVLFLIIEAVLLKGTVLYGPMDLMNTQWKIILFLAAKYF